MATTYPTLSGKAERGFSLNQMYAAKGTRASTVSPTPAPAVTNSRIQAPAAVIAPPATAPAAPVVPPPATPTTPEKPSKDVTGAIDEVSGRRSRLQNITTAVPEKPLTEDQLIAQRRQQAQGLIDSVNANFAEIIKGEEADGVIRDQRTRALNVGAGLGGSDFASAAAETTQAGTRKIIAARQAERAVAIQAILHKTDERAREDAAKLTATYKTDAASALKAMDEQRASARTDIAGLAGMGLTADDLKQRDSDLYKNILAQSGFTEAGLKLYMAASQDKGTKLGESEADGKKYFFFRNGDGSVRTETIDVPGLASGDKLIMAPDGTPLIYGNGGVRIADGFVQGQFAKPEKAPASETDNAEFKKAQQFIDDNPNMSKPESERYIRANTSLPDDDITSLLADKTALTKDYFRAAFSADQLESAAADADYTVEGSGFLGMGKKGDSEAYLTYLDGLVSQYKKVGYSDEDILKMMTPEK